MNAQDRSSIAASRVLAEDEQYEGRSMDAALDPAAAAIQAELDLQLWDIRLAGVLNIMDIARSHGEHRDWTSEHAAQIRAMMAIADAAVVGSEGGVVPQGFGRPIRTQLASAFLKASAARAQARTAPASVSGATTNGSGAEAANRNDAVKDS
jgi:hypothetical protein